MLRKVASRVAWVGRTASMVFGLALVLALVFGTLSVAVAHTGGAGLFHLGHNNVVRAPSTMTGNLAGAVLRVDNNGTGAALRLEASAGRPPLQVNANSGTATNLSADKLDGKDSTEIGVNGLQLVSAFSNFDSNSPKSATARCPADKIVVGTGYEIQGAKSFIGTDTLTDVVVDDFAPFTHSVFVQAYEEEPTSADWDVRAVAICAKAP